MKEYTSKNKEISHTLNSRSATVNPASVLEVLQTYRYPMLSPNVFQSKSKLMKRPPIQCKIGMEFQSVGKDWNVKKMPDLESGITEKSLKEPEHGEEIWNDNGLSVQTDFDDLEYVTSAFDEKKEQKPFLDQIKKAAATHKFYTSGKGYALLSPNGGKSEWISELNLINSNHKDWWIINGEGEKSAHPQATVGVELENIDAFIGNIMSKVTDIQSKDRKTKKRLIQSPMSFKKVPFKKVQSTINAARKRVHDYAFHSDKAKGFAHIVMQYVQMTTLFLQKQEKDKKRLLNNAKNAMSFMSRTSLDALYKLLNEEEQEAVIFFFKKQTEYKKNHYLAYENPSKKEPPIILEFKEWVDELNANKKDKLVGKYHSVSAIGENPDTKTKMKYGVEKGTDIGDSRSGVIMELRALTRNVEPEKWVSIASMILKILNPVPADL